MMRLDELLARADVLEWRGAREVAVAGVSCDSRAIAAGEAFFALPGAATHGRRFVADAVARGAAAVVAEDETGTTTVPVIRVADARRAFGLAGARCAGDPSRELVVVGITGTNGKTTTTHLLEGIWKAAGLRTGVIGTIAYRYGDIVRPAPYTTPDAPALHRLLADMRAAGVTHVAMEVSSHALAQARVDGLHLDAAALTNATRDHLDYHGDFERYVAAKARLFLEVLPASCKHDPVAVLNVDDPSAARLAAACPGRVLRVARCQPAAVTVHDVDVSLTGSQGVLEFGGVQQPFRSRLIGTPHVENVVVAAGIAWGLGVDPATIAVGIEATSAPPGRIEQLAGPGFTVIVDYAHSPDALDRLLETVRPLTTGALITVFGCGGDRDRGKRPLMGRAAAARSDFVIVTSDNPRSEHPSRILADIEVGVRAAGLEPVTTPTPGATGYVIEEDRRSAIGLAIGRAHAGDVVVIAGKGHEDYQIVGSERRHFDDREEVRAALERLR